MQAIYWLSAVVWFIGVVGLFCALAEYDATRRMKAWPFRRGVIVLRHSISASVFQRLSGDQIAGLAITHRSLTTNAVLVRLKSMVPRPLPVLGTLHHAAGSVGLTCRVPLGTCVFWASWWALHLLFGLVRLLVHDEWVHLLKALMAATLFVVLALCCLWFDRRRIERALLALGEP